MRFIRSLMRQDPLLVTVIVTLALFMKLFVPAGYMIGGSASTELTVSICSGIDEFVSKTVSVPAKSDGQQDEHDTRHLPCAFTALAMAAFGGADAPLLALALGYILLIGLWPSRPTIIEGRCYRRPPSRAPPIFS